MILITQQNNARTKYIKTINLAVWELV